MYAASLLQGPAQQWLETLIDPTSDTLPPHYTQDIFMRELTAFFGGGITQASLEHSLDDLRQTGTVSELAIAFQNIVNTFTPRWTDSAAIYFLSRKLKDAIRFELGKKGDIPDELQAYIAAAIAMEHNLAAGRPRSQQPLPQNPSRQALPPPLNPSRPPPASTQNPAAGAGPMDLDGTRGTRGPLSADERRRRADNNLCAYCGQAGHLIASCPGATRGRQARGTYPGLDYSGYFPPPGFPFPPPQGSFPSPWMVLPPPHTQFGNPPPVVPKNDPPSQ